MNPVTLAPLHVIHKMFGTIETLTALVTRKWLVFEVRNHVSLEMVEAKKRFLANFAHVLLPFRVDEFVTFQMTENHVLFTTVFTLVEGRTVCKFMIFETINRRKHLKI